MSRAFSKTTEVELEVPQTTGRRHPRQGCPARFIPVSSLMSMTTASTITAFEIYDFLADTLCNGECR
jgi:hypothetical protein